VSLPQTVPFNTTDESTGLLSITLVDENTKFNVNSIVNPNNTLNQEAYESFKRMLKHLSLSEEIADMIADWIDNDAMPRLDDSEDNVGNAPLRNVGELLYMPGVDNEIYDKLYPYITIYGGGQININGADIAVLMTLSGDINEDMAKRIISYRRISPFKSVGNITKVAGFETLGLKLTKLITVKSKAFSVTSTAVSTGGIKKVIHCVLNPAGLVIYWEEV
jgi:general secretion pathway protein K